MPRPKTILQSEFPYSIGAKCINGDWFNIPMDDVWNIMSRQLYYIHKAYKVKIHAFVLMNNHYHLLMSTPLANLDKAMWDFAKQTSFFLTKAGNRENETYAGNHWRCIIKSHHYYLNTYKYFYRNPVEAGIVNRVEEYKYSTLSGLLGQNHLFIPVDCDGTLFSDVEGTLDWLNQQSSKEDWEDVGNAIKKPIFKLRKNRVTKKRHNLEYDLL